MNIRHAYSKEDPSPDERLLWGALVDDADALALLRIGYSDGLKAGIMTQIYSSLAEEDAA